MPHSETRTAVIAILSPIMVGMMFILVYHLIVNIINGVPEAEQVCEHQDMSRVSRDTTLRVDGCFVVREVFERYIVKTPTPLEAEVYKQGRWIAEQQRRQDSAAIKALRKTLRPTFIYTLPEKIK